jgi:hypothetical protein
MSTRQTWYVTVLSQPGMLLSLPGMSACQTPCHCANLPDVVCCCARPGMLRVPDLVRHRANLI